ncbi:MAG: S41 family peptidase [Acidobacteriota bacterium]
MKRLYFIIIILGITSTIFPQSFNPVKCRALSRDWKTIIDTTWAERNPTAFNLTVFDSVWNTIDRQYACFQNLDIDWKALKDKYRPEIEAGVTRGRFAAIMNYLGLRLQETHTKFSDPGVNYGYVFDAPPGVPILYTGVWGRDSRFGAGLTPLADSTLLVYQAVENHPLGLIPGDIVLGYDGVPWKKLYKELLKLEIPINMTSQWGANNEAFTHLWLSGAGQNWHLFDTIDIKKFKTGEIVHLPTNLLVNKKFNITYSEQLPVPGVPWIDKSNNWSVAWGMVEGTKVGYIYVWNWFNGISVKFHDALDSLINVNKAEGLILDFRANYGGYVRESDRGLSLLFKNSAPTLSLVARSNPYDHFQMKNTSNYIFSDDSTAYFDKPIAVLTGPMSISASDFIVKRLQYHPKVRVFGKSTSSAFASASRIMISNIELDFAEYNGMDISNPGEYLTHKKQKVDDDVWLTPEDVNKGEDSVVKKALKWINDNILSVNPENTSAVAEFNLKQNYPNPFNPATTISYSIPKQSHVEMRIFDMLGREVSTIASKEQSAGEYKVQFDASTLPSGVYIYTLQAGQFRDSKKLLLLK